MTGKEFQDWLATLPDDDAELCLILISRLVLDSGYPSSSSVGSLRSTVKRVYEHRPNRTWDKFIQEIEARAAEKQ
jgi:hypothetical protein